MFPSDVSLSDPSWISPSNIEAADGAAATYFLVDSGASSQIIAQGFGQTVPTGARVKGVVFSLSVKCSTGDAQIDFGFCLNAAGAITGVQRGNGTAIGSSYQQIDLGSPTDDWSGTFVSDGDVNSASTGIALSFVSNSPPDTISIDWIKMKVYFDPMA